METKSKILFLVLILLIISLSILILIQKDKINKLEDFNYLLRKNISNQNVEDNITINLDITNDTILRIGVYSNKHYEITENSKMQDLLDLLNNLSFIKTSEKINEKPIYNITFYTLFDREIFNIQILSKDTVKINNTIYKCTNENMPLEEFDNLI